MQGQEVLQDLTTALRQDAFRVKLHSPNRKLFVLHAHDFPFLGLGRNLEALRQSIALDDERMIACSSEWVGHSLEKIFAVVLNHGSFAVHHPIVDNHVAAEDVPDALVTQANSKCGDLGTEDADNFVG